MLLILLFQSFLLKLLLNFVIQFILLFISTILFSLFILFLKFLIFLLFNRISAIQTKYSSSTSICCSHLSLPSTCHSSLPHLLFLRVKILHIVDLLLHLSLFLLIPIYFPFLILLALVHNLVSRILENVFQVLNL